MAPPPRPAPSRGKGSPAPQAPPAKAPPAPPPAWVELARLAGIGRPQKQPAPGVPPKEGRPPRFVVEPTLTHRICQLLAAGASRQDACLSLGVSPAMMSRWMHAKGGTYRRFRQAVDAAEGHAAANHSLNIARHSARDWRASLAWLERRRPDEWARKDRVTVAGDPRAPVSFVLEPKDVSQMTLDEVREYRARILAQAADAGVDVAALVAKGGAPSA
jgi:hypothetical protein